MAFLVVGIENIGIQIEQPFSVLPLDSFSRIIEADTMEQLQVPDFVPTSTAYDAKLACVLSLLRTVPHAHSSVLVKVFHTCRS